jgi:DNA polymerase-3 subunit alpha
LKHFKQKTKVVLLNCHTYYSYKFGTLSIEQLVQEAKDKSYDSIVLSDINNTSACLDFIRQCQKEQIKPILGIDFRNGAQQQYIGIARNNDGFKALNEHLTEHLHSGNTFPVKAPSLKDTYVIYPFGGVDYQLLKENEFVGLRPSQLNKLRFSDWKSKQDKLVVLQPVSFRHKRDFNIHRLLRAIDNNVLLSRLPKTEEAQSDEIIFQNQNIQELYKEYPQIIQNTQQILDRCSISFEFKTSKNKQTYTESHEEDFKLLKKEALKGLKYRYKKPSKKVIERMEKELKVIKQLNFCSYFLINWDMVNYARSKGCYYVGRGSGANSMVAFFLRI